MAYRYATIKVNGKTKLLHRHLMEQHLGRALVSTEVVHHRDGDRWNNAIANLEITSHAEHSQHHNQRHPLTRACDVCGVVYAPLPTKRSISQTCGSAGCYSELRRRQAVALWAQRRAAATATQPEQS